MKIPEMFRNSLMRDEEIYAATEKHNLWMIGWWLNLKNIILGFCTFSLIFWYKRYLIKNEAIVLTNKRLIGSVSPKLFTKDKIELTLKSVDNIKENETIFGNIFGWTSVEIETRSQTYSQNMITKESAKKLKNRFFELT